MAIAHVEGITIFAVLLEKRNTLEYETDIPAKPQKKN
jgi:hypothetical protein